MASPDLEATSSSSRPLVEPRKWTTRVNIAIVVAVMVVFLIGTVVAWWMWGRHRDVPPVHEQQHEVEPVATFPLFPLPPVNPQHLVT